MGGGLLSWKSRQEGGGGGGGGGLVVQEIQVRGGVKKRPHPLGVCGFFLEQPITD